MAPAPYKPARFKLPARIRSKRPAPDGLETRLALIDRIASLHGIETVERSGDTVPCQVDVYLRHDSADRARKRQSPPLLCSLNCNGVLINSLDSWAQHQVVSRGWGKLISDQVLVFTPRDSSELEVVWKILQQAYDNLFVSSAREPAAPIVSIWDLPKFSRTTLQ